ncbi:hypothetical protein GLOIN_2v1870293 [Rhizophagus clarus]|uniref:DUF4806 domain-containing protein n=1 Tax=Rhizophagus clarus TaxID=94130 RepID=A0A8H3M511_9GLOM|nr:hypothetical protein GLOIN_2v1870293 [Rhizophagus clarus]
MSHESANQNNFHPKNKNINVWANEIGLELMLGYYVSIDSLDERNTCVEFKPKMLYIVSNIFLMGYGDLLSNMQSELDSLEQRVVELLAENADIKAENVKVKAENAKLRQAMEENETRLAKLEQSDKEKAKLIAELNCDVGKIKQERVVVDVATQPSTSNKSLEDRKTDEFLVSVSKKKVSDMMRQRNREKKLLHESAPSCRDQDEHSTSQNTSNIPLEDPNDSVETEANKSNSQSLGETIPEVTSQVLPKETKVSHDYIIAQDFIQEVTSELIDEDDIQVIDGNQELTTDMTIEVELAHLFLKVSIEGKNTTQAKQKEILCRHLYGKKFEESIQEIIAGDNVSDQTARKQLFQDIIKHLSGITLETLRKRTQRAIKIYKLFEKIGVDRIKNIKSYSADSISKFTKSQIQIILDYFSGSGYADMELKKPNSYSGCKNTEKVRPKVPLEKSQGGTRAMLGFG